MFFVFRNVMKCEIRNPSFCFFEEKYEIMFFVFRDMMKCEIRNPSFCFFFCFYISSNSKKLNSMPPFPLDLRQVCCQPTQGCDMTLILARHRCSLFSGQPTSTTPLCVRIKTKREKRIS